MEQIFTRTYFWTLRPILKNVPSEKLTRGMSIVKTKLTLTKINDGQINLLVLNRKNIFCEIGFLICIHKIPSMKFAIFETQFAKVSSLETFCHENVFP